MDRVGIISSMLCMIHCICTPFLFIVKVCSSSCCSDAPLWWQMIDYIFLVISFIAIYSVSKNTTISWLKFSLWISWIFLLILLTNHSYQIVSLNSNLIYIPGLLIVALHFYNLKYCSCPNDKCKIDEQ